ncbi:uncharacterized protein LOC107365342 [Tetranychus urticae]|uniref:PH domain-containing protein n=1 Tax=Tetranychus urticae TaxID=32264 RepID=T1JPS4_TETUR|nr:uncharacterized protein LOC107365342 [Tetranychus urticae]XP_015788333.1 uncharacterized protein LOC107365342 [Tetranychus urticae]
MENGSRVSPTPRSQTIRDVYKCGFLKYFSNVPKGCKVTQVPVKYWVTFAIMNEVDPFLELYSEKPSSVIAKPTYCYSLKGCLHLCPAIVIDEKENCFEFSITLESQLIRLVAPTRQSMDEWIDCIKTKLKQMNIIGPQDNYYTKEPNFTLKPRSSNQSSRPLPPIPPSPNEHSQLQAPITPPRALTPTSSSLSINNGSSVNLRSSTTSLNQSLPSTPPPPPPPPRSAINSSGQSFTATQSLYGDIPDEVQINYEPIFGPVANQSSGLSFRNSVLPHEEGPPPYEDVENSRVMGSNSFGQIDQLTSDCTLLSLRESQILRLQKEIAHKDGVKVMVRKKDCNESIALVDWLGKVWIAGWKQKMYPQLHNTFHIGDCLISVCGERVYDSCQVLRLMKTQPLIVEIILSRVPYGFVFVLKRDFEGQDLGIVRDGNTAEVIQVIPDGLAASNGLTDRAPCVDQTKGKDCNWVITEINNRPLNLFFKGSEIRDRLNAVGKDISLLFQPSDLVKVLKKRLKSFKNYKDYIVQ